MRWEMEKEEIEAAMERIWDLHDKLSDAIHSISRANFLHSVGTAARRGRRPLQAGKGLTAVQRGADGGGGFVFVKGLPEEEEEEEGLVADARSLHLIRSALENLEDQFEFLRTVQSQQRAERDAAIARLEQSRIILAMRLVDHEGKKYKVIEEALEFVGNDATPRDFSGKPKEVHDSKRQSIFRRVLMSGMALANKLFRLGAAGGVIGNATFFAISLVAAFQLHQVASRGGLLLTASSMQDQVSTKESVGGNSSSNMKWKSQSQEVKRLDVLSARG